MTAYAQTLTKVNFSMAIFFFLNFLLPYYRVTTGDTFFTRNGCTEEEKCLKLFIIQIVKFVSPEIHSLLNEFLVSPNASISTLKVLVMTIDALGHF